MDDEDEQIKDVYARFGLAIYFAQVLEHGIVNALLVLGLIPTRRHLAPSKEDWAKEVDAFMDRHFEDTMGRLMNSLRSITTLGDDLESLLRKALGKRNWLVHDFFRERAEEFNSGAGRQEMLKEIDGCRELFQAADASLASTVRPLRSAQGITDEWIEQEMKRLTRR
jgi:hypothetical protein